MKTNIDSSNRTYGLKYSKQREGESDLVLLLDLDDLLALLDEELLQVGDLLAHILDSNAQLHSSWREYCTVHFSTTSKAVKKRALAPIKRSGSGVLNVCHIPVFFSFAE